MKRTLSSLAMIATLWDVRRKDCLDCFLPFLASTILKHNLLEIKLDDICNHFKEDHGLWMPLHPMQTLLKRAAKKGIVIVREYLMYANLENARKNTFGISQESKIHQFDQIVIDISKFAKDKFDFELSNQQVEDAFITFLAGHDAELLFAAQDCSLLPQVQSVKSNKFVICKYLEHVFTEVPNMIDQITDIAVGHIMANSLLLGDTSNFKSSASSTKIFLDTRFILRLVGLEGEARKHAYVELTNLMRKKEGRLYVFQHTYDEIMLIFNGCKRWLQNSRYDPSKASHALRYFVQGNYTPSEVDLFVIRFSKELEENFIEIFPPLDINKYMTWQIDEAALTLEIKNSYGANMPDWVDWKLDDSIYKDVKSISYVNLIRQGKIAHTLRKAGSVFVTTNGGLARANRNFEQSNGGQNTIYACVTDVFIGTVLWAQSPATMRSMTMKNLIANISAALQPDHILLDSFMSKLTKLKSEGEITEDESVVLRSSRLTMNLLSNSTMCDPTKITDRTPQEILEAIKESAREPVETKLNETEARLRELESSLEGQRLEIANRNQRVNFLAESVATFISWLFFLVIAAVLVYGAYVGARPVGDISRFGMICVICFVLLSLWTILWGKSLRDYRFRFKILIKNKVKLAING